MRKPDEIRQGVPDTDCSGLGNEAATVVYAIDSAARSIVNALADVCERLDRDHFSPRYRPQRPPGGGAR